MLRFGTVRILHDSWPAPRERTGIDQFVPEAAGAAGDI
jgi:hypothetical protein